MCAALPAKRAHSCGETHRSRATRFAGGGRLPGGLTKTPSGVGTGRLSRSVLAQRQNLRAPGLGRRRSDIDLDSGGVYPGVRLPIEGPGEAVGVAMPDRVLGA